MSTPAILFSLLAVSFIIEATVVAFPFVLIICLTAYILYPDLRTVLISFLAGIIIDILKLSPMGITSAVILVSFLIIDLVRHAFEIKDYKIMLFILFAASFAYSKYFSYSGNLVLYILIFGAAGLFISYFFKKISW